MEVQRPQTQTAIPVNTPQIHQTEDDTDHQFYDHILTQPDPPKLQHVQITPPQNTQPVVNPPARRTRTRTNSALSTHSPKNLLLHAHALARIYLLSHLLKHLSSCPR